MTTTVTVTDMSCDGCEDIVEGAVEDVAGVESATADRDAETVTIEGDADVKAVMEAIDYAGYTPERDDGPSEDAPGSAEDADSTVADESDASDADAQDASEGETVEGDAEDS
ncbi:MAG: heavy-metal-associated domain-containing protein [Halanaeroarchaeum sp.]